MPAGSWSTQQLTEFLSAISRFDNVESALRGAVERAAEALDAEIGAIISEGKVLSSIGFPPGQVPEQALIAIGGPNGYELELAGVGRAKTAVAAIEELPAASILLARSDEQFSAVELNLLGGMARVLSLTLVMLRTLDELQGANESLAKIAGGGGGPRAARPHASLPRRRDAAPVRR